MTPFSTVLDRSSNRRFKTMTQLDAVLQRARNVELKLNKDKLRLRQTDVKCMGNIPPMTSVLMWTSDSYYRYEKI